MRKIKLFEEYDRNLHKTIKLGKKFQDSNFGKKFNRIGSFIDDVIHLDFDVLIHSFKNKSAYNKLEKIINELSVLKLIMTKTNGDVDFEDLYKYGIDDKVLLYINDEDVKEYLLKDTKLFNRIYLNEYLDLFTDYSEWKEQNGLNESYDFKIIHHYECNSCSNMFKSKSECESCPKCESREINTMDEVEWYKQID